MASTFCERGEVALLQLGGVDELVDHLHVVGDAAVDQRLVEALVALLQLDVLADHADADHALPGRGDLLDDLLPLLEARGAAPDVEELGQLVVEPLAVQLQRHLVDRLHVEGGEDRARVDVAEERDLVLHVLGDLAIRAAQQDVGLDADLAQLLDRVLGRLGLQLAGGGDVGDQGEVDVDGVLLADVVLHLPDGLEERQRLDVADRAADLDDEDVGAAGRLADHRLDLVGDVRDHLHRLAQVLAAPLPVDDVLVDAPGGVVVLAGHLGGGEPLVVAEVEVGLGAVVGDEDLAVLERAHGARVDVDVGVELEVHHLQPAVLQQRADRRRRQPLAQRADHAAGHEQVLGLLAPLHHVLTPFTACWPPPGPGRAPGPPACRSRTPGRRCPPPGS